MLIQILELFKQENDLDVQIKTKIEALRKLKSMIEIEKLNTKRTTLINNRENLKNSIMEGMVKDNIKEKFEKIDGKTYKLAIRETKDFFGKDIAYLFIDVLDNN